MQIWKKDRDGRWLARQAETLHGLEVGIVYYLIHRANQLRCREIFIVFSHQELAVLGKKFKSLFATRQDQKLSDYIAAHDLLTMLVEYNYSKNATLEAGIYEFPNSDGADLTDRFSVIVSAEMFSRIAIRISRRK